MFMACAEGFVAPAQATNDYELAQGQAVARARFYGKGYVYSFIGKQLALYPCLEAIREGATVTVKEVPSVSRK